MNQDKVMEKIIEEIKRQNKTPSLLLHCCCAPCSSAVLERLAPYFKITVFFYNPNIVNRIEYKKRKEELKRFLKEAGYNDIFFIDGDQDESLFLTKTKGLEEEKEGGKRCYLCYEMRLSKTAKLAKEKGFDYFGTTLSISPYKNAAWLNEIGERLMDVYQVSYLYSDFKKRGGYQRSITLSKEYNLYRQDYCGCPYSKKEREEIKHLQNQIVE